eukprot:TRINITY_DN1596_c0_g1_i3.p7 TRINITY_DN1596_c0_g1~~TRINITY_DN1596_c0_g1_i3.p7  ORF type:complete len:154 (-),score=1.02 TRINITY_DN1596_c0_g1_i3:93-554(-)
MFYQDLITSLQGFRNKYLFDTPEKKCKTNTTSIKQFLIFRFSDNGPSFELTNSLFNRFLQVMYILLYSYIAQLLKTKNKRRVDNFNIYAVIDCFVGIFSVFNVQLSKLYNQDLICRYELLWQNMLIVEIIQLYAIGMFTIGNYYFNNICALAL